MLLKLYMWLNDLADSVTKRHVDAALAPAVVTYSLPGAPPTGSQVMTTMGLVFERRPAHEYPSIDDAWGVWEEVGAEDPMVSTWGPLLTRYGTLTLLPESPEERALAAVYGPAGARWGDPDTPCPYVGPLGPDEGTHKTCALGIGHVGPHRDWEDEPLGMTSGTWTRRTSAAVAPQDMQDLCTCGSPGRHKVGCPRHIRTTGTHQEES